MVLVRGVFFVLFVCFPLSIYPLIYSVPCIDLQVLAHTHGVKVSCMAGVVLTLTNLFVSPYAERYENCVKGEGNMYGNSQTGGNKFKSTHDIKVFLASSQRSCI